MKESGKERFILTKSYEIAYALFRLATPMQEKDFSEKLRTAGANLLEAAAAEDYVAAGRAIQVMECLVKFAGDANVIGTMNAEITLKEIYALDAAIAERKNASHADEASVAEIFSNAEMAYVAERPESAKEPKPAILHIAENPAIAESATAHDPAIDDPANTINGILKSAMRQTAILDRIRQSGNCRLKDIQDVLPDTSERTIRYDLQTLLEQNLIERVGSAGPSVFYRAVPGAV
jgi:hypothetical protein